MSGWIKKHRKMKKWEWYKNPSTCRLFDHLLLSAEYKPKNWRGIDLIPGQLITGRKELSQETGLSEQQIRTSLNNLQKSQDITIKSTNKFSIITIVNWGFYQGDEENQPANSPAINQQNVDQLTTTKEIKNKRKKEGGKKIPSLDALRENNLNGHIQDWFEKNAPSVNRFTLREKLIAYCESEGRSYKDYWATMRTWAMRDQEKAKTKPQQMSLEEAMADYEF